MDALEVVRSFGRGINRAARGVQNKVRRDGQSSSSTTGALPTSSAPSLSTSSTSAEEPHASFTGQEPDLEAQIPVQTASHNQYAAVPLTSPPPFAVTSPLPPTPPPAHTAQPQHLLPTLTLGPSAQHPTHDASHHSMPPQSAGSTLSAVSDTQTLNNNSTTHIHTLTVPGNQSLPVSPLSPPPAIVHSPASPSFTPSAISFAPQLHPNSPVPQPLNLSAAASPAQYLPSPLDSPLPLDLEQQISGKEKDGASIRPQSARPRTSRSRRDSVIEKVASLDPRTSRRRSKILGPKTGNSLMDLPPELQLLIIDHLEFGELENLRRTCRFYRNFLTKQTIRDLFGEQFRLALLAHCYICLKYDPTRGSLLWADYNHPRYPLASKCVDCAYQKNELSVGKKVALGNYASVWICRWCGYPVTNASAPNQPEFHKGCYEHYNNVLLVYFVLGWIQLSLGIVAGALCWRYFKDKVLVLAPSIVNFILLWWCLALLIVRGEHKRTYHISGIIEATILGLWCMPLYTLVGLNEEGFAGLEDRRVTVTLVFVVLNMFFRLLNLLGNVILTFEWRHYARNKPRSPPTAKFLNLVLAGLVYWTYPQSIEQEYPPQYHFFNTGRRRIKRILAERNHQRQQQQMMIY
ncbi:f-box domain-containing protein [Colletotrichum truncatum]|uniref:F-box domain-containing protein n=1 Tax=Colletotrichum truncatum TaxID=5467 RepID=A0ACC3Z893_COLTU|nr:f-box domain-containing protein [Colletotrichum truncatum]KAF6789120.1 f-box domain-containing protein [Colletotrichum truncatum]